MNVDATRCSVASLERAENLEALGNRLRKAICLSYRLADEGDADSPAGIDAPANSDPLDVLGATVAEIENANSRTIIDVGALSPPLVVERLDLRIVPNAPPQRRRRIPGRMPRPSA